MLDKKPLNRILIIDIEATSLEKCFADLSENKKKLFIKRFKKPIETEFFLKNQEFTHEEMILNAKIDSGDLKKKKKSVKVIESSLEKIREDVLEEMYNTKAPIFPEWGKILCISIGAMWKSGGEYLMKITSFFNENEEELLRELVDHPKLGAILNSIPGKYEKNPDDFWAMCAFNGMVYDFPFIAKRLIINGIKLPKMFDYSHLKPWELEYLLIDPKKAWQMNVFDAAVSLEMLTSVFDIPTPKDGISGADVKDVFWIENDLPKIAEYCEKDVLALGRVLLKMKNIQESIDVYAEPKKETSKNSDKGSEDEAGLTS